MTTTTDLGGRLAARGRARRRTRLAVTLTVTVLLALGAAFGYLLLGTAVLGVHAVDVAGVSRVDPAEVRSVAQIKAGTPLARLDTGAVAARVARLPAVRSVSVHRSWPRTVTITVRERQPAAVQAHGPSFDLVDRTGVAFATVDRRPAGLPLVSAPVDAGAPALRSALTVLADLPPALRSQVRQVRAASPEDVELALTRGRTVLWGSTDRGPRKAAVLAVLVARKARVYDVTAPDAPTTRR